MYLQEHNLISNILFCVFVKETDQVDDQLKENIDECETLESELGTENCPIHVAVVFLAWMLTFVEICNLKESQVAKSRIEVLAFLVM